MKKAYYAYMISKYSFLDDDFESKIAKVLVNYTLDPSVYCRENSLKALYSMKNIQTIVEAYLAMNSNKINHNTKLVTDGLLSFKGDKVALAEELWKHHVDFNVQYQVAFIDFVRMITDKFCDRFYEILTENKTDNEVKYSIIRYFRKYRYKPIKEYLYYVINNQKDISWEYAALAASALDNYPCVETNTVLKEALTSSNWYVRYNAADSLLNLGLTYPELKDIYKGSDRFAKEMIEYKMQEYNIIN